MSDMCTHEHKVGSVVTVRTQAKAGCPLCEAEALRERAEKAELRAKALDERAGLNDLALERAQLDRDAAVERAEKAEARVREMEEWMSSAMIEIAYGAIAFAIFGAWSTEPWR